MTTTGSSSVARKRKPMTGAGRGVGAFFDDDIRGKPNSTDKQPSQHTDIQTNEGMGDEDVFERATFYIRPGQHSLLEEIKLKLRRRNVRTNKSELIREAIDMLSEQELAMLERRIVAKTG